MHNSYLNALFDKFQIYRGNLSRTVHYHNFHCCVTEKYIIHYTKMLMVHRLDVNDIFLNDLFV